MYVHLVLVHVLVWINTSTFVLGVHMFCIHTYLVLTYIRVFYKHTLTHTHSKGPYKERTCSVGTEGHSESNAGFSKRTRNWPQQCGELIHTMLLCFVASVGCCQWPMVPVSSACPPTKHWVVVWPYWGVEQPWKKSRVTQIHTCMCILPMISTLRSIVHAYYTMDDDWSKCRLSHIHTFIRVVYTQMHTHVHTYAHTYTLHMLTHTCTHTHTHSHTRTLSHRKQRVGYRDAWARMTQRRGVRPPCMIQRCRRSFTIQQCSSFSSRCSLTQRHSESKPAHQSAWM